MRELDGQTVVVIGGSAGIGLETARRARAEGAEVVLAARNPDRLEQAAQEVGARSTAAFDANDTASLEAFFRGSAGSDRPCDGHRPRPALRAAARDGRGRRARGAQRPRGAGARGRAQRGRQDEARRHAAVHGRHRRPAHRSRVSGSPLPATAALPPFVGEPSRSRSRRFASTSSHAGFVDTPLSASLLGDQLDERRNELRATLPIGRVVGPADVAALAVHIMTNTALTGATYDIDGGQQFIS